MSALTQHDRRVRARAVRLAGLLALSLAVGACASTPAPRAPARPNILLIVADDLGVELGAYGDRTAETPRLDRLASEGVLFERAHATTGVCCPSRAGIYTGRYPHGIGMLGFVGDGFALDRGVETIAILARRAGYAAFGAGKLHAEPKSRFPWDRPWTKFTQGDTAGIARLAGELFDAGAASGRPFFVMLNPYDPHDRSQNMAKMRLARALPRYRREVVPLPSYMPRYENAARRLSSYYRRVRRLDATVAAILEQLERRGLGNRTVVVFTSDHGPPFEGAKRTLYEPGVRVPLIVRWPGHLPAGRRVAAPVSLVDLVPTFCELMGLRRVPPLDGISLLPLLTGGTERHPPVFGTHTYARGPVYYPQRSIVAERFKYIRNLRPDIEFRLHELSLETLDPSPANLRRLRRLVLRPPEELYDLERDPLEERNLAGDPEYAEVLADLRGELRRFLERTHDPLLDLWNHRPGDPDRHEPAVAGWSPRWLPPELRQRLLALGPAPAGQR